MLRIIVAALVLCCAQQSSAFVASAPRVGRTALFAATKIEEVRKLDFGEIKTELIASHRKLLELRIAYKTKGPQGIKPSEIQVTKDYISKLMTVVSEKGGMPEDVAAVPDEAPTGTGNMEGNRRKQTGRKFTAKRKAAASSS